MRQLVSFALFTAVILGFANPSSAQRVTPPDNTINCAYNTTPPTLTNGQMGRIQCDSAGNLIISPTGGASGPMQVVGNAASGATDSGNPIKIGSVYNSAVPTPANGQRIDSQSDASGNVRIRFTATQVTGADGVSNAGVTSALLSSDTNAATTTRPFATAQYSFNGTSWDRGFTCPLSAVVSVTAGSTTQIVALAASQIIRVCGFSVSMSAAGTAQWVYGTGANCGTGTTNLTGATTLATGTPWTYSAGVGSVMRSAASNALCLAAVTGNVTGIVTYAQY